MLMDIVKNVVASQDDFELAGEIIGREGLLKVATQVQADFVILRASPEPDTEEYHELLYGHPRMKIIAIAADGREAAMHELHPRLIPLGEVAPETLITAIRSIAQSGDSQIS
jgi:DNA-binding NarL/FixJ family response regulator